MRLGVDFDNTLVCYDRVFFTTACEQTLIPPHTPPSKEAVRDYLRSQRQEEEWTRLQGYVYGARMAEAKAFPGAAEFLRECHALAIPVFVVSHKTRYACAGPRYDLHQAAYDWLRLTHFLDERHTGLSESRVFFELSREAKLERIARLGCTHFIDDLPECLLDPAFPPGVERILFAPHGGEAAAAGGLKVVRDWDEAKELLL